MLGLQPHVQPFWPLGVHVVVVLVVVEVVLVEVVVRPHTVWTVSQSNPS